jgi:hypothetical protein
MREKSDGGEKRRGLDPRGGASGLLTRLANNEPSPSSRFLFREPGREGGSIVVNGSQLRCRVLARGPQGIVPGQAARAWGRLGWPGCLGPEVNSVEVK